jgi:hypothetical protein
MTTVVHNLTLYRGITFDSFLVYCFEDDELTIPKDITGWTPWSEVRAQPDDTLILNLAPFISNAVIGEVTIPEVADEVTITLTDGKNKWDFTMEDPTGDRHGPYIRGSFIIKSKITQGVPPE